MSNPIQEVINLGQSIWFDNIQRRAIKNGELKYLIDSGDIRGITSNPSIFNQAITNSDDYDEDIKNLAANGLNSQEVFWKLAVKDIQDASDLFLPLYYETKGKDGFVSLEVNPEYSQDPTATFLEAKGLWAEVDRPNLMIKIPATQKCIPAIKESIAFGINVNVTLIFSIDRYREVMQAYIEGLMERVQSGLAISNISSVASFFISRIDSKIDPLLPNDSGRKGKSAIANAKLAYLEFERLFSDRVFLELKEKGGQLQRPLWASTSTKNERYPDTLYIDELIGPDTVNTIPPHTLEAFREHGVPGLTLTREQMEAKQLINDLKSEGISFKKVTDELEREGIKAFVDSFSDLIKAIERKIG
ncbi:transaldolase [Chloroflexota bacterium]